MFYTFEGRVRYSEIGEDGRLTLPGILNYSRTAVPSIRRRQDRV